MYLADFVIVNDFRAPKPFAAVSQLLAALQLPLKNMPLDVLKHLSCGFYDFYRLHVFWSIFGVLDLYFWWLDLSLRSAKGVNNCQVNPSAHMQTARGLLLTESTVHRGG